jgi:hypothetical protein
MLGITRERAPEVNWALKMGLHDPLASYVAIFILALVSSERVVMM